MKEIKSECDLENPKFDLSIKIDLSKTLKQLSERIENHKKIRKELYKKRYLKRRNY